MLAVVAILGGCGGTEDTPVALTKAQFIKRGDEICKAGDKKQEVGYTAYLKKQGSEQGLSPVQQQEKVILEVGLPPLKEEAERLEELGAPKGDEAKVEAILTSFNKAVEESEKDPSRMIDRVEGPFVKVEKLSRSYGFKYCGQI